MTNFKFFREFYNITGIPAVLNTSFNLHGEPNVSSYDDAFYTFKETKLKYLVVENYLVKKTLVYLDRVNLKEQSK